MNKTSFLIVTRNSTSIYPLLFDLEVFYDSDYVNKIHIVDNGSTKEYLDELNFIIKDLSIKDQIIIHKLKYNYLYSRANNYGMDFILKNESTTEFICIMNPDLRFSKDAFDCAGKDNFYQSYEEYNNLIIGGILLREDHKTIEHIGCTNNSHISYNFKFNLIELKKYYNATDRFFPMFLALNTIEWLTGAFLILPVNIIKKIGFFDQKHFTHWCSDQEYCRRFRLIFESNQAFTFGLHCFPFIHEQGTSSGNPHKEVLKDLPPNIIPNIQPFTLQYIKQIAEGNSKSYVDFDPNDPTDPIIILNIEEVYGRYK